jgi:hypothetical protein
VVPKTKNGLQAIDDQHRSNRNCGSWVWVKAQMWNFGDISDKRNEIDHQFDGVAEHFAATRREQIARRREVSDLARHLDPPLILASDLALDQEDQSFAHTQPAFGNLVPQTIELVAVAVSFGPVNASNRPTCRPS